MIRKALLSGLTVALSIATSAVTAQTAHVHGKGRVNIAIDGNRIYMELESPGADIVGFEHEAHSSEEKTAVARAIAKLGDPMQLLSFEADAGCEVRASNAKIEGEREDEGHAEHDEHDEHEAEENAEHDEHDEHEAEEHAEHDDEEAHGAFVAEYEFECVDIGALGFIEFTYFSQFDNAQSLDIVLIDGSGQRSTEIDRTSPVLQLGK